MTESTTLKKKKSIIWATLAGILLAALVVLFLLPNLVSTDWAGNKIKQAVNDRLPGTIDFETLSVSWFSGIKSRQLTIEKTDVRVHILNNSFGLRPQAGVEIDKTDVAIIFKAIAAWPTVLIH